MGHSPRFLLRFSAAAAVQHLAEELRDDLAPNTTAGIPASLKILVFLRYLASASFQLIVADTLKVSQPTVSKVVRRVALSIVQRLRDRIIRFPPQDEAAEMVAFHQTGGFPGVIGCIDGTQIRIVAPHEHENDYINRKGYHSLNVQAVCSANGTFSNVVVHWPGSVHDSRILRASNFYHVMEAHQGDGVILGDSGYPNKRWLMTPYRTTDPGSPQERFNQAHARTRSVIERSFGRLKRRFYALGNIIRMTPERSSAIIMAAFVLHNVAIVGGDVEDFNDVQIEVEQPPVVPDQGGVGAEGAIRRNQIAVNYFGAVAE